jgi:phosphatidate cytidylyltransferase
LLCSFSDISNHNQSSCNMQMSKNQVLRQRTITGIFFAIGVVLLLFSGKTGAIAFGCFIAGFSCYEYIRMIFHKNKKKLVSSLLLVATTIILLSNQPPESVLFKIICFLSMLCFAGGIFHLFRPFVDHKRFYWLISAIYFGLPLGLFVSYVYHAEHYYPAFWMAIIIFIWIADSGAYLIGSRIGKRLLFERISPKKTWEGFSWCRSCNIILGSMGMFSAYFTSIGTRPLQPEICYFGSFDRQQQPGFIGTLGDLVESSIKTHL